MSVADTAIVALRESLEAVLIIGILLGIVSKLGYREARKPIWIGAGTGVAVSVLVGVLLLALAKDLFETFETEFEVVASLVAVGILTYMIVWMYKHTISMVGGLHAKAKDAVMSGRSLPLLGLAFVVVVREGLETVVFTATQVADTTAAQVVVGLFIGFGITAVISVLVFRGIIKFNMEKFFAVTGVFLIVIAGGLLGYAAHEAEEIGWIPASPDAWDTSGFLPHKCGENVTVGCAVGGTLHGIMGYRATPSVVDLGLWFLYVGGMTVWYLMPIIQRNRAKNEESQ